MTNSQVLQQAIEQLQQAKVPLESRWMMTPDGEVVQLTDSNGLSVVEKQQ